VVIVNREFYIVDTTLRDGEQKAGLEFSIEEKLKIAKDLDEQGIYQIEAGIPAMGNLEKECICRIIENRDKSLISTWNRLSKKDIDHSMECKPDIIHISVPTSDIQIYSKLKKDRDWIERNLLDCVYYTKSKGFNVTIGFEDASRTDINYLISLCKKIQGLGVDKVRDADTVGILTPSTVKSAITSLVNNTGMDIEIHCHNDFGMAIANSIEAVKYGAKYVNCTLDGIGERAGNCCLQSFIDVTKNGFMWSKELKRSFLETNPLKINSVNNSG
jgi:homocitrate synthase NifV